jgi:hypothetical protein
MANSFSTDGKIIGGKKKKKSKTMNAFAKGMLKTADNAVVSDLLQAKDIAMNEKGNAKKKKKGGPKLNEPIGSFMARRNKGKK